MPTDSKFIEKLLTRRSVLANNIVAPGPSDEQVQLILEAAHRVPDHKKIGPWRFIVLKESSSHTRKRLGEEFRQRFLALNPEANEQQCEFEAQRLQRAPLIIAVVANVDTEAKAPVWEQELAVGAVCQNLLNAVCALGFVGQWLTEWYSYDDHIAKVFGLTSSERFAGFFYIGSCDEAPKERVRPGLGERIQFI
ncbi:MAG: nitroreductase [Flavobacteriales bacterium]|jgi:nitroreductase